MDQVKLLDCTLRDGANVIGNGFPKELTEQILNGLISNGIQDIEMGNCLGLGAFERNQSIAPLTDEEYLELIQPYLSKARIGMFLGVNNAAREVIEKGASYGLHFLRIGANAGDGRMAEQGIHLLKQSGLMCRYSMMKAYLLEPHQLAEEAKMLEDFGADEVTIMDSAGTMEPDQVKSYVSEMVAAVQIPVGFHGHNNLGFSIANAAAAVSEGAMVLDTGLMGMARSAGNCSTELITAVLQRKHLAESIDLYGLFDFIDQELAPAMAVYQYKAAIAPLDIVYGQSGCHSSFYPLFSQIAREKNVPLYPLIVQVSKLDQKCPSKSFIESVAEQMRNR